MIPQSAATRKLSIPWGKERRSATACRGSRAQARHCLRYLPGRNIQAGGRFSFAATEPRNREHTGEDKDQYGAHNESAADEAARTFSNGILFCHWTALSAICHLILNDQFCKSGFVPGVIAWCHANRVYGARRQPHGGLWDGC